MNFKTRVRSLQKATGWAYQRCHQALRNAGSAPAELAKALGCSLLRADVLTVAPGFDVEHALMLAKTKPSRRKEPDSVAKVMKGLVDPMDQLDDKIAKVMKGLVDPMDQLDDKIAKVMKGRVDPMDQLAARGAIAGLVDPMGKTRW